MTRERDVEAHYKDQIEAIGGLTRKFTSPGHRAVPDQISAVPWLPVFLTELKAPGEVPSAKQLIEHAEWRAKGVDVYVVDTIAGVDELIASLLKRKPRLPALSYLSLSDPVGCR